MVFLKEGMGALVKGHACLQYLYVSSRLVLHTCNVNRSSQGMWHHAVLSNRFWILYSWSEIEKKQRKTFGTEATLHFGFESCKVKE